MQKLILSDCDGVLLDWLSPFEEWSGLREIKQSTDLCVRYQLPPHEITEIVDTFNLSLYIQQLPPHKDAVRRVRELYEYGGYYFRVITKCGDHPLTVQARIKNLKDVFGPAIEQVHCLPHSASKEKLLVQYKDIADIWIDDHTENALAGLKHGYHTFFMNDFEDTPHRDIEIVQTWKQITDRLI